MDKICLQCGDIGYETFLVLCIRCMKAALHSYCMDVMPNKDDESVDWLCDECKDEQPLSNQSSFPQKPIKRDHQKIPSKNLKKNQTGNKSGQSFLYSFAGFGKLFKGLKSEQKPVKEEEQYDLPKAQKSYDESDHIFAEPIIRSVWTGSFNVRYDESIYRTMDYFSAYLSSKASQKAYNEAVQFKPVLQFEMLPKSYVWPKIFQESGPTDDNITVYFFPSLMKHQGLYDYLVFEMIRDDKGMRALVQNAELLVFTSVELPLRCRRFQGKLYLWGLLKGKQVQM